jgi:hypothetical protein
MTTESHQTISFYCTDLDTLDRMQKDFSLLVPLHLKIWYHITFDNEEESIIFKLKYNVHIGSQSGQRIRNLVKDY